MRKERTKSGFKVWLTDDVLSAASRLPSAVRDALAFF
jgi:hypothetical protein